ncbi:MAG: hypothetical protein ACKPKO_13560, partial [Candidatus Fonsibacter sp.]
PAAIVARDEVALPPHRYVPVARVPEPTMPTSKSMKQCDSIVVMTFVARYDSMPWTAVRKLATVTYLCGGSATSSRATSATGLLPNTLTMTMSVEL